MGGHALDTISPDRLERSKYLILEQEVINKIKEIIDIWYVPRYFNDKGTFGDLDILYYSEDKDIKNKIVELLESKEQVKNANIFSCAYNEFQVDFIKTDPKYIECYKCFLDYSSYGEILSKMFKKHELKYKHNGLYIKVYYNNDTSKLITEICLTQDSKKVFEYIGLNYEQFKNGFETKEEMFEYLINCKYFTKETFINDNLNKIQRKKEKVRPIYKAFIEYIKNKKYAVNEHVNYCKNNKTEFLLQVIKDFNKEDIFNEENKKYQDQITIRNKFNGKIVSEITQLIEKELGKFIAIFKGMYENFDKYVLENNSEQIKNDIALLCNRFKI